MNRANKHVIGVDSAWKNKKIVYYGCSMSKGHFYYNFSLTSRSQSLTNTGNMLMKDGEDNINTVKDLTLRQKNKTKQVFKELVTNTMSNHIVSIIHFDEAETIRRFIGRKGIRVNLISIYLSLKYDGVIICSLPQHSSENTLLLAINEQNKQQEMSILNSICEILLGIDKIYEQGIEDVDEDVKAYLNTQISIEVRNKSPDPLNYGSDEMREYDSSGFLTASIIGTRDSVTPPPDKKSMFNYHSPSNSISLTSFTRDIVSVRPTRIADKKGIYSSKLNIPQSDGITSAFSRYSPSQFCRPDYVGMNHDISRDRSYNWFDKPDSDANTGRFHNGSYLCSHNEDLGGSLEAR